MSSGVKAPNVLMNLPTVGADVQPTLSGKDLCGGHRYNHFGMISFLTYPQICLNVSAFEMEMSKWPTE